MTSETHHIGSMDNMNADEIALRVAAHGANMLGQFVTATTDGEILAVAPITLDHRSIGSILQPGTGTPESVEPLFKDLSPEQMDLAEQMKQWRDDPEIDFQ
jgi:hypothetical protein